MPCVITSEIFHGVGRKGGGANQMIICLRIGLFTEFMSDRHPVFYAVFSNA